MPTELMKLTIRIYNMRFGDCFLLPFHYASPLRDRQLLIDFGSVGYTMILTGNSMQDPHASGGKPCAVVAAHRRRDHIKRSKEQ